MKASEIESFLERIPSKNHLQGLTWLQFILGHLNCFHRVTQLEKDWQLRLQLLLELRFCLGRTAHPKPNAHTDSCKSHNDPCHHEQCNWICGCFGAFLTSFTSCKVVCLTLHAHSTFVSFTAIIVVRCAHILCVIRCCGCIWLSILGITSAVRHQAFGGMRRFSQAYVACQRLGRTRIWANPWAAQVQRGATLTGAIQVGQVFSASASPQLSQNSLRPPLRSIPRNLPKAQQHQLSIQNFAPHPDWDCRTKML